LRPNFGSYRGFDEIKFRKIASNREYWKSAGLLKLR
jgi:hypothetical protein